MTATQIDDATSAQVAAIVATVDARSPLEYSFDDFVAWGAKTGAVSDRLLDFLRTQGDLAGSTPLAYQRLTAVGETEWFKALPGDTRRAVSTAILGEPAMRAYMEWAASLLYAEPA